jgi:hypothetical protein
MPSTVDIQDFINSRKLSGFQTTVEHDLCVNLEVKP